jgi:light-regulated signal transduction histidine kinase (bacteriophytochrome)
MKPHLVFSDHSAVKSATPARAERILRGMHKVYSHDLPNQLVVLQSLLQLLQMEELDRLSPDGREYVERLTSAARTTGSMVRFLKEMGRLHGYQPQLEDITLSVLGRELSAELNQMCPRVSLAYEWDWQVPTVRADYRPFSQAILALLQARIDVLPGLACRVEAGSRETMAGAVIDFRMSPSPHYNGQAGGERPETVLAREWLATCGAELDLHPEQSGQFSILIPR